MKEAGLSLLEIRPHLNRNVTTRACRAWFEEHKETGRRDSGSPRVLQPREDRLLRRLAI